MCNMKNKFKELLNEMIYQAGTYITPADQTKDKYFSKKFNVIVYVSDELKAYAPKTMRAKDYKEYLKKAEEDSKTLEDFMKYINLETKIR